MATLSTYQGYLSSNSLSFETVFICRYVDVSMNVCHVECSAHGRQNRASDSLELEFIDNLE